MSRPRSKLLTRILHFGFALGLVFLVACENKINFEEESTGTPSCQLLETSLDFGRVTADGSFVDRQFAFRNIGGGQLAGTIRIDSDQISIISGGGFYSLGPGQLRRVTVRFRPDKAGEVSGQILVGHGCRGVTFSGLADPSLTCAVSPFDLDFGTVLTNGDFEDRSFTITNPGAGTLTGTVSEPCEPFSIVSGGGDYTLAPNETRTVTIRFQPTTAGSHNCLFETGSPICADVTGAGVAENVPLCDVQPAFQDLGTVQVGSNAQAEFTITNLGGGVVEGVVNEACPAFTIVSGGGAYSLGTGESRTVTVRFEPASGGLDSCRISLGASSGCDGPLIQGRGQDLAVCQLSATTLDFGTVAPGGSADRTFTITNSGGGTLSGNIQEQCDAFSIVTGAGLFSLGEGASQSVTVRFQPVVSGPQTCAIQTGIASCPAVNVSATAEPGPACETSVTSLDFGTLLVNEAATLSFILRNAGGDTLTGVVSEACPDFTVTTGGGPFNLTAGGERTIEVRFQPLTEGMKNCTIAFGSTLCAGVSVSGTGEGPPACQVLPTSLSFGNVGMGSSVDKSFTIRNTGGGILSGTVTVDCPHFGIAQGDGTVGSVSYNLGAGEVDTVTIRFQPETTGNLGCTVLLTSPCGNVTASGTGQASQCRITPLELNFGKVVVGGTTTRTFTIQNTGGTPITGNVTLSCPDFSFQSNGGPFTLNPGSSARSVIVRFSPTSAGQRTCIIDTGTGICADVTANAEGDPPPACSVDASAINFGTVTVGEFRDRTFTITNTGGGTLAGTVAEACPDYSIVGGGGYSLAGGTSKVITVRFAPLTPGLRSCPLDVGGSCADIDLSGTGDPAAVCSITGAPLAFGTVNTGAFLEKTFTITNTGGDTLTGNIVEGCGEYTIQNNGGPFSLTAGMSRVVTVRFSPVTGGNKPCTIDLGTACNDVSATGFGDPPPVCSITGTSLNFGNAILVNTTVTRSFTITNTGGRTLSGTIAKACAGTEYTITTGNGNFNLTAGQAHEVIVRLIPTTAGSKTCTITTGTDCGDVSASGTAVDPPICTLSTTSLNFGLVTADGATFADRTFRITNTGGQPLNGTVSEGCSHYAVTNGGSYSLNPGQFRDFTVRFTPTVFGTLNCSISTSCTPVSATGVGAASYLAHVRPLVISTGCGNGGSCHNGFNGLPDWTIYATASSPMYVNLANPPLSPFLQRPSGQVAHSGGTLWPVGGSQYNTVLTWIQQGVRQ